MKTSHPEPLEANYSWEKKKYGQISDLKFQDLSLWRRPACQTLSKALDISSATAWIAPELLKALAILADTINRRSAVDQEDLQSYWKIDHISLGDQQSYYL